jgi:sensor domain CHASE-containing protein
MKIDPQLFYALFGLGQFVLCGIGAWTLTAVIKQGNRLTKVETLLETSLITDIADLKQRVREVETSCKVCR